jgi:uroporphyrinogen-III decarboxylase
MNRRKMLKQTKARATIATLLLAMNIPFDIIKGTGPIVMNPVRSMEDVKQITHLEPEKLPFVAEALGAVGFGTLSFAYKNTS